LSCRPDWIESQSLSPQPAPVSVFLSLLYWSDPSPALGEAVDCNPPRELLVVMPGHDSSTGMDTSHCTGAASATPPRPHCTPPPPDCTGAVTAAPPTRSF
ncbi:hypothetical protein BVRB_027830, partial [Beta vulgaris subsp. vulgaris]